MSCQSFVTLLTVSEWADSFVTTNSKIWKVISWDCPPSDFSRQESFTLNTCFVTIQNQKFNEFFNDFFFVQSTIKLFNQAPYKPVAFASLSLNMRHVSLLKIFYDIAWLYLHWPSILSMFGVCSTHALVLKKFIVSAPLLNKSLQIICSCQPLQKPLKNKK